MCSSDLLLLGKVPDAMHLCINRDAAPVTPPRNPLIRGPNLVDDMAALSIGVHIQVHTTNRKPSKDSCGVPTQDSWEPDIRAQQPPSQPASEQPPPQPAQPAQEPAADWGHSDWGQSDWWSESGGGYTQADWDEWKAKKREEAVSWQSASSGSNQDTAADNRRRSAKAMWEADSNGQWSAESWEAWKADAAERKAEWAANNFWSVKKCRR